MEANKKITGYCLGNSEIDSVTLNKHLSSFKSELEKNGLPKNKYKIIDGNLSYPKTKQFLEMLIDRFFQGDIVSCSSIYQSICITEHEKKVQNGEATPSKNISKQNHLTLQILQDINPINFLDSIGGKIVIVVDKKYKRIKEALYGAHGISQCPGRLCITIKGYKNIIWHETAHLLGADDHYKDDNVSEPKDGCKDHQLCIMQWNPADKQCIFCNKSIEEIKTYY